MKKKSLLLLIPFAAAAAVALGSCGKEPGPQCDQASVILDSQAITIEINETKQLTASSNMEGCSVEVNWRSDDASIASVDQNGVVTGHKNGTTTVYANDVPCLVAVGTGRPDIPITGIELVKPASDSITMVVGDTQEVLVNVLPNEAPASDKVVNLSSSKESVVIINENGEIEAVGAGTAKVTITSEKNPEVTKEINITVNKKVLTAPEKTVDGLDLVHNESLNDGDYVYFTAIKEMTSYVMMAYESGNNVKPAENTVVGDKLGVNAQGYLYSVIKNADGTYSFADYTNGRDKPRYLAAKGGEKNNYLKVEEEITSKSKFTVAILDGKATINCVDEATGSTRMAYNTSANVFSCYSPDKVGESIYAPIQVYRVDSSHEIPVTGVEMEAERYEVPVDGELKVGAHVLPKFATDQEIQYSLTNVEPVDSITLEGNVLKSSGVGSGTLVARSNSGNVEASVPVTSYEVTPIVANGVYTISETRDGVTYYMTNNENKAGATTDENLAVAVDFIKVEHKINTYRIKVSDGTTYMHVESNNITFVEGVENASEFIVSEGTKEVGAYDIAYSASDGIRHITLEDTDPIDEFKANKSGIKENTDLTPSVVKHITGITVDTKPNKLEYFVNQVLDTTGMVVSVHFDNETEKVITNYDVSKDPFEEAGEAVSVEVEYQGFKDTFTVKVKERTLTSITLDGDMENKNYQRTESFDPTGLRVMGTYDNEDYEELDSALYTLSYDPEKANTVGDNQTVTVTATMNAGSIEPAVKAVTGVNVSKLHVTEVKINGNATQIIEVGQMLSLTASVKPTDADEPLVVFSAEEGKESVLSVSQDGIVTATGVGKAKVIATSLEEGVDNPVSGSITVEVVEALPNETNDGFKKFIKLDDIREGSFVKFFVSRDEKVYGMGADDSKIHQPGVVCSIESEKISVAGEVAEFQAFTNDDGTYSFTKDGKYLSAEGATSNGLSLVSKQEVEGVETIPANARFNILFENGRAVIKCANEKRKAGTLAFYDATFDKVKTPSFTCTEPEKAQSYAKVAMFVKDPGVTDIKLNVHNLALNLLTKTSEQLIASYEPDYAVDKSCDWSSSKPEVATVSDTGLVEVVAVGETTITVTTKDGLHSDTCEVVVTDGTIKAESVSFVLDSLTLEEKEVSDPLAYEVLPTNTSDKSVTFTSSNEAVATVDGNGVVTAVAAGDATITVASSVVGTVKDELIVYVTAPTTAEASESMSNVYAVTENGGEFKLNSDITVEFVKNDGSQPKMYADGMRCYGGNSIVISSGAENIQKIEFTTGKTDLVCTADVGNYAAGVWEGDASSVTFSLTKPDGAKTTNLPISGIKVTYKRGSVAPHAVLRNIEIATMPDKLAYNEGEFFDPTGLVVNAIYSGSSVGVDVTKDVELSVALDHALTIDDDEIVVSYTEEGITKSLPIAITVKGSVEKQIFDFSTKPITSTGYTLVNGVPMKFTGVGGHFSTDAAKGEQFGSSGNPEKNMSLSFLAFKDVTIKKVVVNASTGSQATASLSVKNGETSLLCGEAASTALSTTPTEYTFIGDVKADELSINFTQSTSKALYVKSIEVYYEDADSKGLYIPEITSIVASADKYEVTAGETVNLSAEIGPESVIENYSFEISSGSESGSITGSVLTCSAAGTIKVVAKQGELTSEPISIIVTAPKVLQSITVTGDMNNKKYEVGDSFDPSGLVATATYTDMTTAVITEDVDWIFDPVSATSTDVTFVSVVAKLDAISSASVTITNIVVKESAETKTVEINMKGFSGSESKSYLSSEVFDTVDGVTYYANNFNPSSGQTKGNQTTTTGNFYLYNSTALDKKLISVTIYFEGADANNTLQNNVYVIVGDETQKDITAVSGGVKSTLSADGTTLSIDLSEQSFTYFKLLSNEKFGKGTIKPVIILEFEI